MDGFLKLFGLRRASNKSKPKAKRRVKRTRSWELIGYVGLYDTRDAYLSEVPEWLQKEWDRVRGTSRTLGGKWKMVEDVDNPDPTPMSEDYACNGYYRTGKKFRYMVVEWEGMMGSEGYQFYRMPRRSK